MDHLIILITLGKYQKYLDIWEHFLVMILNLSLGRELMLVKYNLGSNKNNKLCKGWTTFN